MVKPHYIIEYLVEKFGQVGRLSASGREFVMPSVIVGNDYKCHLSINVDTGLWQDFKTGDVGNFAKLLTIVENISYEKAKEKIFLLEFEDDGSQSFTPPGPTEEAFPEHLIPVNVNSHSSEDDTLKKAWMLLYERSLFNIDNFDEATYYVATDGKYKDRLIVPFKNENNDIFYFQARALKNQTPKYLNPMGQVKPSDILYPFDESQDYVVICEGPLDAISLQLEGVNATCTMGCVVSETQADILRDFGGKIILGYDNDEAGIRGIEKFENLRKCKIMPEFHVTALPPNCKDWNDAKMQKVPLAVWVSENTKKYDYTYKVLNGLSLL